MNSREAILKDLQEKIHSIKPGLPMDFPPDDHFKDRWHLDSLDLVELVARVEYTHQLNIPDADLEKFTTLNNIVNYLLKRKSET